jgi:hypothetical protein
VTLNFAAKWRGLPGCSGDFATNEQFNPRSANKKSEAEPGSIEQFALEKLQDSVKIWHGRYDRLWAILEEMQEHFSERRRYK